MLEGAADMLFLAGLLVLVVASCTLAWEFGHVPAAL